MGRKRWIPVMSESHVVEHPAALLAFLIASRPGTKKTRIRQWLKYGSIQVNGRSATHPQHALRAGDVVTVRATGATRAARQLPPGMRVLFEDEALIVIEKPTDLLSMASAKERSRTAYALLTDYARRRWRRRSERVWIVHRLDRQTSGLMVFARTAAAKRLLQAHWATSQKRYLAVVEGEPPAERGVLSSHLDESNPARVYSAPRSDRTRHAVTRYRVVTRRATRALVELTPETGRRNQLRVHLADAGCPIVGDRKYGARTDPAGRLALHATFLRVAHPRLAETLTFESPLPADLARLV